MSKKKQQKLLNQKLNKINSTSSQLANAISTLNITPANAKGALQLITSVANTNLLYQNQSLSKSKSDLLEFVRRRNYSIKRMKSFARQISWFLDENKTTNYLTFSEKEQKTIRKIVELFEDLENDYKSEYQLIKHKNFNKKLTKNN